MKRTPRLASVLLVSLLLAVPSSVKAFRPQSPTQEKATETSSSLAEIQASIKHQPQNAKLYIKLGQAFWNGADYQSAFEAFKQEVKLAPASAEAHNWMGACLMGRGNLPDSISELRKAVSLDPKYPRAYTNLGSALAKSGDMAGAVAAFQKALILEPNSWAAHLNLGLALRENGDAAKALVHLRRSTDEFAVALFVGRRGIASNEVLAEFREALRLRPDHIATCSRGYIADLGREQRTREDAPRHVEEQKCPAPRRRS